MNAKYTSFIKCALAIIVVFSAVQLVSSDDYDDESDGDDVTLEVEQTEPVVDVPYTSPIPSGNFYLAENFDNVNKFKRKWVLSQTKKEGIDEELAKYDGVWQVETPQKDGLKADLGLVLKSQAKHAAIAAKLDKVFHFLDKPIIVQYEVNFQEGQECGGAYLKLLSQTKEILDLKQFHDKTPYTIMFGPDKCGNDLKLHFIFRHQNPKNGSFEEKHCKKPKERLNDVFEDKKPHLYTLIIKPDNSFTVKIDHKVVNEGSLLEDFTPPVNPESEIDDPDDVKPNNWDEREEIPDPDAKKPDDWDDDAPAKITDTSAKKPDDWLDDEPLMIPDPDAEKPDDWDSDMDGEWEAPLVENPACEGVSGCGPWSPPQIDNPAYKGKWKPPMISNPNYQGKWKPRKIPNPDYFVDLTPFKMTPIAAIGFELWSMSSSILFDNIIITDSIAVADDYAAKSYDLKRRKIDQDSVSLYGRVMRSINYKPGWWTLYGVYCLIPVVAYSYYLYTRIKEESLITRILKYSNERPYLYAIYIVAIGLPIALFFVFCCGSSKEEKEEMKKSAEIKKTDAFTADDKPIPAKTKSQLDIQEENIYEEEREGGDGAGEDEAEDGAREDEAEDGAREDEAEDGAREDEAEDGVGEDGDISQKHGSTGDEEEQEKIESGQGDVSSSLKKRRPLKE